MSPEICRKRV